MSDLPPDPFGPTPLRPTRVGPGRYEVSVEAIPLNLDDPDLHQWCPSCLLPSAVGYRFRILANGAPMRGELALDVCLDCGHTERRRTTT